MSLAVSPPLRSAPRMQGGRWWRVSVRPLATNDCYELATKCPERVLLGWDPVNRSLGDGKLRYNTASSSSKSTWVYRVSNDLARRHLPRSAV